MRIPLINIHIVRGKVFEKTIESAKSSAFKSDSKVLYNIAAENHILKTKLSQVCHKCQRKMKS